MATQAKDQKVVGAMAAMILKDLVLHGSASFVDLERIPGVRGELSFPPSGNLLLWKGVSQTAFDAIGILWRAGLVHFVPVLHLQYVQEGKVVELPIAEFDGDIKGPLHEPHWLPMVLKPGPQPPGTWRKPTFH